VFLSVFVRAQHKINVKAPEDHQLLEVGIDSAVAAERSVAQINDAESKKFILDTMTMRKDSEVMQTADTL
jgi:hypothetical protein